MEKGKNSKNLKSHSDYALLRTMEVVPDMGVNVIETCSIYGVRSSRGLETELILLSITCV